MIVKINNCLGYLSDVSAKAATLAGTYLQRGVLILHALKLSPHLMLL